jgi:hypothetical protein
VPVGALTSELMSSAFIIMFGITWLYEGYFSVDKKEYNVWFECMVDFNLGEERTLFTGPLHVSLQLIFF